MQNRTPIIAAIAVAVVAALMTMLYINQIRAQAEPAKILVAVASRDLVPGTVLSEEDIAQGVRYAAGAPRNAIEWNERTLFLGQELRLPVSKDDYILETYFGSDTVLATRLSEKIDQAQDQRAITIPVDAQNSLEGSIRPGDRIDILITYQRAKLDTSTGGTSRAATEVVTTPLLENVYVMATGRFGSNPGLRYNTMTLLVSPDEAKVLVWAQNLGSFTVLLRNPKDLRATDRAFLAGSTTLLENLGKVPMKPEDVIREPAAAASPAPPLGNE